MELLKNEKEGLGDAPQFISLYRQEVTIDFLLRFFHPLFFTAQPLNVKK
jgi:hypothetical protein